MTEDKAREILAKNGFLIDGFWDYDGYLRFSVKIPKDKVR